MESGSLTCSILIRHASNSWNSSQSRNRAARSSPARILRSDRPSDLDKDAFPPEEPQQNPTGQHGCQGIGERSIRRAQPERHELSLSRIMPHYRPTWALHRKRVPGTVHEGVGDESGNRVHSKHENRNVPGAAPPFDFQHPVENSEKDQREASTEERE